MWVLKLMERLFFTFVLTIAICYVLGMYENNKQPSSAQVQQSSVQSNSDSDIVEDRSELSKLLKKD